MFPINLISRFNSFPAYTDMRKVEEEFENRLTKYFESENCWLNEREQKIIWSFFKEEKTLQKIGDELFITRERVRQIIAKSVEKLNYINSKFKWFYENEENLEKLIHERDEAIKELQSKIDQLQLLILNADFMYFNNDTTIGEVKEFLKTLKNQNLNNVSTIDDLDLTVRTYNCLKRSKILRITDIVERTEEDFMKIRNMGQKSVKELKEKINELGLSLKGE